MPPNKIQGDFMTIYFSENIRNLRKEKGLTQEALAEVLGVSYQAISKWERGESYPDITLLPAISSFFNTTTDDLLGVDKSKREKAINGYIEKFDKLRLKDTAAVLADFEKAIKDFPNNFPLLVRYMELLTIEKDNPFLPDYESTCEKLLSIYENIQKNCTDDSIRLWSKRLICGHLFIENALNGNKNDINLKSAEKIINGLPAMTDTKEYMSLRLDSSKESHLNVLEELLYLTQNVIFGYSAYLQAQEKIQLFSCVNNLLNEIYHCENYGKNYMHLIYNYGYLGHFYFETGDEKNSLKYLRLAAENAVKFDADPDAYSPTAKYYNRTKLFYDMNMCTRMTLLMKKHYKLSDDFRNSDEFREILGIMGNIDVDGIEM